MYGSIEEDEELRKSYVEEHLNMKLNSTSHRYIESSSGRWIRLMSKWIKCVRQAWSLEHTNYFWA